jgi:hypothetical protein
MKKGTPETLCRVSGRLKQQPRLSPNFLKARPIANGSQRHTQQAGCFLESNPHNTNIVVACPLSQRAPNKGQPMVKHCHMFKHCDVVRNLGARIHTVRSANAISGSIIQNSARCRVVLEFSARKVGPNVYTLLNAAAYVSTWSSEKARSCKQGERLSGVGPSSC